MAKKADKVKLSFVGMNASEVTGSMNLIEYQDMKILVDAGLYQSNSIAKDYKVNSRKLGFKPSEIDYIFITHINIDHFGLLPRLYADGCKARIITHHNSVQFFEPMLKDSAFIMSKDALRLQNGKFPNAKPIYTEEDVAMTVPYIRGYDKLTMYKLNEQLSFKMKGAGHIIGAVQDILYITKESGHVEKLAFSGDLGNTIFDNPFIEEFEPVVNSAIFVGECTYGSPKRSAKKGDREKDMEKLSTAIDTICIERGGRVFIPCFALQRTQTMLSVLYDMYGEDENFDLEIIVDSPLAIKVTNLFNQTLTGEDKAIMDKLMKWDNVRFITDPMDSRACVEDNKPKIVLSASGMIHAGRSVHWARSILPRGNDCIVTCGFMCEGTIGWRIKNGSNKKRITVQGKRVYNRCQVINLKSFSSHMQYNELINYYKNINTNVIYLVHGNMKDKITFKRDLEIAISKMNKTTRVVAVNKGTRANI